MSLKIKVYLFFTLLLLVSLLSGMAVLISNARQSVKIEMETTMKSAARIVTISLSGRQINREVGVYDHVQNLVDALSEIRSLHILVFDQEGLLFEGEPEKYKGVEPPDWFVKLLLPRVMPLTKKFGTGHMVIYAAPIHEVGERWLDIRGILMVGLAMFLLVSLLLYWGVDLLMRPLQRLLDGLSGFERGELHLRLPKSSLKEMNQISQTFNRMGQTLQQSMDENRRLAALVQQSGDAILSLDKTGKILLFNPAAEKLLNMSGHSLQDAQLAEIGFIGNQQKIVKVLQNCETVLNLETALMLPSGDSRALLLSTVPLTSAELINGVICTLRDITEHKQAQAAKNELRESRLLAQHMSDVQEQERRHLARELHDELGQCLTAIKTDAVLIRNRTEHSEPKVFTSAQAIIDIASHIYDVVHNMITRLRPSPLDDLGLVPTLEQSIASWQVRHSDIRFNLNVMGELESLTEALNMTVFRIVQESITNAVRHADAAEINITLAMTESEHSDPQLEISISDNGKGMEVTDFHSDVDFGLLGMRERAQSLGGRFELKSELGKGLTIHVILPVETTTEM